MDRRTLVREIAYRLFEHRGRLHGRDVEDWLEAEQLVEACLATSGPARAAAPPSRPRAAAELAPPGDERRALELLARAAAEHGRATVAARLGYRSTGVVSELLRGERALPAALAARIEAALGPDLRLLPGGETAAA